VPLIERLRLAETTPASAGKYEQPIGGQAAVFPTLPQTSFSILVPFCTSRRTVVDYQWGLEMRLGRCAADAAFDLVPRASVAAQAAPNGRWNAMTTTAVKALNSIGLVPRARSIALSAVVVALLAGVSAPARADAKDDAMQPVWLNYWEAISAAQQCEDRKFSGADYDAMVHVINGKVDSAIGAGPRNHLITVAKDNVSDRVVKYGCHDSQVGDLLALFHNELQPALPQ